MSLMRVRTNSSHGSQVLPSDLGYPIPASGGFVDLFDAEEVESLQNSEAARDLLTDDAYSPEATLILVDTSRSPPIDVPQGAALYFLDGFQGAEAKETFVVRSVDRYTSVTRAVVGRDVDVADGIELEILDGGELLVL